MFAAHYFSPALSGFMLGAILITVITCAGGLALGIATMITRDLYQPYVRPRMQAPEGILVARTTIVVMVVLGVLIGGSDVLKLIISYSFLAFAFRADAMLVPVLVAVIGLHRRLNTVGAGVGALVGGILTNISWNLVSQGGAAVFIGLAGSVVGLLVGHVVSVLSGGKRVVPPVFTSTTKAPRASLEG